MGRLFDGVRELVSAREAAEFYGLSVNRQNKALCPWHPDRTPSLSFKGGRCKCFVCDSGGSSIDIAARLLECTLLEAAKRLNADFNLGLDGKNTLPPIGKTRAQRRREFEDMRRAESSRLYVLKQEADKVMAAHIAKGTDDSPEFWKALEVSANSELEIINLDNMTFEEYESTKEVVK